MVGFYADPSAGWAQDVKGWEARYSRRLRQDPARQTDPVPAAQRCQDLQNFAQLLSAIHQERITYDGDPMITAHLLNARKSPRQSGYVLVKPADDQDYSKIDAAWGAHVRLPRPDSTPSAKGATKQTSRRAPRRLY